MRRRQWFGPRRWGWGYQPVTWEGWTVTVLALVLLLGADPWVIGPYGGGAGVVYFVVVVGALLAVCAFKGTIGGHEEWREFRQRRQLERTGSGLSAEERAARRARGKANLPYRDDPSLTEVRERLHHINRDDRNNGEPV